MQSMIKLTPRHKVYIKSKLSARNILLWHEHTLASACAIHRWLHPRQTAAVHATRRSDAPSVRWCHEFSFGTPFAASYPRFYSQQDSDLGSLVATDLVRWILEYHVEEAEECLVLGVRVHCLVERKRNPRTFHRFSRITGSSSCDSNTFLYIYSIRRSPWCPEPQIWDQ